MSPSLRGSGLKCSKSIAFRSGSGLPLYEGVDWNNDVWGECETVTRSPSLRGSGLKSLAQSDRVRNRFVSLFTREWIEIPQFLPFRPVPGMSPSLRGSGLKLQVITSQILRNCLPLYEGVDWNLGFVLPQNLRPRLPLYEGVDWNGGIANITSSYQ